MGGKLPPDRSKLPVSELASLKLRAIARNFGIVLCFCLKSGFQVTAEKTELKQLLRPITTRTNSAVNQSQFIAITCNSLYAREKSRVRGAIGFGFTSHWLKNWRESFKPITERSNRNHVITSTVI